MDTAETKLVWGYCCSREQPLPREIMKSKTATGRATVVPEPDEYHYIRWESFLEAQHPPSRMGEKPSDSCSAKRCGHSREFCTCPSNASLPTSTRTSPAQRLLPVDLQPENRGVSSTTGTPALPPRGESPSIVLMNQNKPFVFVYTPALKTILRS